jgi:RNA polymerase-binding transcription factor DksA
LNHTLVGEAMLTTGKRILLREVLRQARTQSVLALAATNAAIEKRANRASESALSAAAMAEQQIDQFIAAEESETLFAIHGALQLLHDEPERYGVCERCGRSLSAAQLRFSPWISSCERHAEMPVA